MSETAIAVGITQSVPAPLRSRLGRYVLAVLIGLDVLVNAICGGAEYQTISCRIGESIRDGGWAASVPWPAWWRAHCAASIYSAIV